MRQKIAVIGLVAVAIAAYGSVEYEAQSLCLRQLTLVNVVDSALTVGDSVLFRAGRSDLMMECDLDPPLGVWWRSTNPSNVIVAPNGWVKAQAPGMGTVVVRAGLRGFAKQDIRVIAKRP